MAQAATASAPAKAPAGPNALQLLAFVFASADMVMEIGAGGRVAFATGAAGRLLGRGAETLLGRPWREFVDAADAELVDAAIGGIRPGERRGPFRIALTGAKGRQPVTISLFQMPQRPGIAAAFSLWQPPVSEVKTDASGLAAREDFEAAAAGLMKQAGKTGGALSVDLLEVAGLAVALAGMEPEVAEATKRKLAATLQAASHGGVPAAGLGADRFAMLRSGQANVEALAERIRELAGPGVQVKTGELSLDPASPAETLRAIRYALDRCLEEGPDAAAKSFEAALRQTVTESARFKDLIRAEKFELVYQPVVDLRTRELHHYEALTRFEGGGGPAETIKLAEELGLVVELDLTVVKTVAAMLAETPAEVRIAANVSAFSLAQPGFVEAVIRVSETRPSLRPRLLLELTESHALGDLDAANARIQALRRAGHEVCLDDFGAGSASLDYLRQLEADVVKFDGKFVQGLDSRPRDAVMLKRLAEMCAELGVETVAEMIETEDAARKIQAMGIGLGQGWLFGKPAPKPVFAQKKAPIIARRRGEVESWG
ncbi:MAG: EAL domain-containing protein [Phenylobacterium sp.]|uniref:EAL domain-containing protein n=1 Tax=Phenylobacterium sp. TaxID=1871053 RepID=UPI001A39A038|nr:EAL domain-containing protein [Phenylobacterium sp.]MBL8554486.1 EAL domain-containing protein [Phenylobacterium sp.]